MLISYITIAHRKNDPANTRRSANVGTMLGQRRRRWANKYPDFIMAMPPNMILVVYHTMYIVLYDFNKLTFLYIHVHISLLLL